MNLLSPKLNRNTVHITSLIGEKKAEQPLPIYGDWKCEFTVE